MAKTDDAYSTANLRTELRQALSASADDSYGIHRLVETKGEIIGVRVPAIRIEARDFHRTHSELTLVQVADLLDELWRDRSRDEILFGIFLLTHYRRQFSTVLWSRVDKWVDSIDNWETCDQLAMNVAGELVADQLGLVDDLVTWAASPNHWRRRFAVAATTALNQKGRQHVAETLRVCAPVLADTERMVQKAVSWALREATKSDERAVYDFMREHKRTLASRTVREVSQKLTEEHRAALLQD